MHVHVCFSITHIIYSLGVHSNFFAKLIATAFTYLTSDVYPRVMCVLAPYFLVQNLFVMSGFDRFLELEGMWLNFLCIIFGHSSSDSSLIAFLYLLTYQRIGQSFWVVFTSIHLICFRKRKKVCDQNFVKVLHICMHWSPPSAPLPPSLPPKTVSFRSLEWWSPGLPCIHATLPVYSLSAGLPACTFPADPCIPLVRRSTPALGSGGSWCCTSLAPALLLFWILVLPALSSLLYVCSP